MTNPYYNPTGVPATRAALSSSTQRTEFAAIGTAFDKLAPTLTANGLLHVNAAGTAYAAHSVITVSAAGAIAGVTSLTTTGNVGMGITPTVRVDAVVNGDPATGGVTARFSNAGQRGIYIQPGMGSSRIYGGVLGFGAYAKSDTAAGNIVLPASIGMQGGSLIIGDYSGNLFFHTYGIGAETGGSATLTDTQRMGISSAGNLTLFAPSSGYALVLPQQTPASAGAAGVVGSIAVDANYIYVCTATNTWKRAALATW